MIVWKFPNVFPDELPGLPLDRDVEFKIYVFSGTTPISIALYRMASIEPKELKAQLQDFLDWGFIIPTASFWGALVLLELLSYFIFCLTSIIL